MADSLKARVGRVIAGGVHALLDHIEDPVLRRNGKTMAELWPNAHNIALSNHPPGLTFQDVHGRIPHQIQLEVLD